MTCRWTTIIPCFLASIACFSRLAFAGADYRNGIRDASLDRYRTVNGQLYDLNPLSDFLIQQDRRLEHLSVSEQVDMLSDELDQLKAGTLIRPLPIWSYIEGKIIQIPEHGNVLLMVKRSDEFKTVIIRDVPHTDIYRDGDTFNAFAVEDGAPYVYLNTQGARTTITSYFYGAVLSESEARNWILSHRAILAPNEPIGQKQKRDQETHARIVKVFKDKATNGLPVAQFQLGQFYLNGNGVETNKQLGIFWLQCAVTNGSVEASNLLRSLGNTPATAKRVKNSQ
jgi:hypothetical protein